MQFAEPAYLCSNKSKKEMKRIAFTVWLTVVSMMAMATHLPDVEGTVVINKDTITATQNIINKLFTPSFTNAT